MNDKLVKYKDEITDVFGIVVEVLTVARSLKTISLDLKLMAINGIVHAAKVGKNQGHSLITLSGFLAKLPQQIAPELEDLEALSRKLSRQITICSISIRRFILYSSALRKIVQEIINSDVNLKSVSINLLVAKELMRIGKSQIVQNIDPTLKDNLLRLSLKNLELITTINDLLVKSKEIIIQSKEKIGRIRRSGFIANYMGSNISIESSYLRGNMGDFSSLVSNIKNTVDTLNENLDAIIEKISDSEIKLEKLIKSGILK